jgi:hypothetical protein
VILVEVEDEDEIEVEVEDEIEVEVEVNGAVPEEASIGFPMGDLRILLPTVTTL